MPFGYSARAILELGRRGFTRCGHVAPGTGITGSMAASGSMVMVLTSNRCQFGGFIVNPLALAHAV